MNNKKLIILFSVIVLIIAPNFVSANSDTSNWLNFDGTDDYITINTPLTGFYTQEGLMKNVDTHLILPTYDGSNISVHPSVIYFNEKWNNWKYWMVMTPYPNYNDTFENPSILVSNDGKNWQVPTGLTNPINPASNVTPGGHNNDPTIVYNYDTKQLEVYWLDAGSPSGTILKKSNSTDGIHWTASRITLTVSNYNVISPSVIYKDGMYKMWTVNSGGGCYSDTKTLEYWTSTTGESWNGPYLTNLTNPTDKQIWHGEVKYIPEKNEYWGVYSATPVGTCYGPESGVFFFKSKDGINWDTYNFPLINNYQNHWDDAVYKSSFLYNASSEDMVNLYYGTQSYTALTSENYSKIQNGLNQNYNENGGTVCMWINSKELKYQGLFGNRYFNSDANWFELNLRGEGDNALSFGCKDETTEYTVTGGISKLNQNLFICGAYNNEGLFLYEDNSLIASSTDRCDIRLPFNPNLPFRIGTYYSGQTDFSFNGSIYDIRVYNRRLSSFEISQIYNEGLENNSPIISNGIIMFQKFNEGSGPAVLDSSGNGNNGTIVGATWGVADITAPTATLNYSILSLTNQNVIATITPSETIIGNASYTFTENGNYTFEFTDLAGNKGSVTASVNWIDKTVPNITLIGESSINIYTGTTYTERGATASDNVDGNLTANISMTGTVDTNTVGTYTITYTVSDKAGNTANATRTINVITNPPSSSSSSGGGSSSSSSGGGSYYGTDGSCTTTWTCSDWGACYWGTQTRTCTYPSGFCKPQASKPAIIQKCTLPIVTNNPSSTQQTTKPKTTRRNFFTGAVTGITDFAKTDTGAITFSAISILIIGGTVAFFTVKKSGKKKRLKKK
jgi:hypothetical protein